MRHLLPALPLRSPGLARQAGILTPGRLVDGRLMACCLATLLVVLGGCERPFADVRPEVTVLRPDLEVVQPLAAVPLTVEAAPFLTGLTLDGVPLVRDSLTGQWAGVLPPEPGLTRRILVATDGDRIARVDTLAVMTAPPPLVTAGPRLPAPRGGHTATRLLDGRLLVTGGTAALEEPATATALLFRASDEQAQRLALGLGEARTGHSATLLPDGRVLILGGARVEEPTDPSALVETAEVFDPVSARFQTLTVDGTPVRRLYHTASVRDTPGGLFVDLYGGVGEVRQAPPALGTRGDVRTFRLEGDRLVAAGPNPGPFIADVWGHAQTSLTGAPPGTPDRYLVAGTFVSGDLVEPVGLVLTWGAETLDVADAAPLRPDRTRHTGSRLSPGRLLYLGGFDVRSNQLPDTPLLYDVSSMRVFRFEDARQPALARYGHTALSLPGEHESIATASAGTGSSISVETYPERMRAATNTSTARILILGGFQERGAALSSSVVLEVALP